MQTRHCLAVLLTATTWLISPTAMAAPYDCGQGLTWNPAIGTCEGEPPEPFSRSGAHIILESDSLHGDVIISQNPAGGCTGSHVFRPEYGGCTIPSTESQSESRACSYTSGGVNYVDGNQTRTRTRTRYAHQNGSTLYSHWSAWGEYSACADGVPAVDPINFAILQCNFTNGTYPSANGTATSIQPAAGSTITLNITAVGRTGGWQEDTFRSEAHRQLAGQTCSESYLWHDGGCEMRYFNRTVQFPTNPQNRIGRSFTGGRMLSESYRLPASELIDATPWTLTSVSDTCSGPSPDPDPDPGGGGGNPIVGQTLTLTGNLICNSSHTYYGYGPYGTPMALVGSAGRNAIIDAYKNLPSQRCPEFGDPPDWTSAYGYWIDQMGRRMAGLHNGEPAISESDAVIWVRTAIPNGAGSETLQNSHDGCQALADETFGAGRATARFITKGESGYTGDSCRVTNIH